MKWVEVCAGKPNRCAVIPFVGGNDPEGYIQSGVILEGFDNEIYVSVKAVNEMANLIGRPTRAQFQEVVNSNIHLSERLDEVTAERDQLRDKFGAIDILASEGFRARNKPGRPKKIQETEVAA